MPRVRVGSEDSLDINLHGTVWDHADLLASLARTNLRSFVPGPWGPGDDALAQDAIRRCATDPCVEQCFIVGHSEGSKTMTGCSCSSGFQYTDDDHVQTLEGCGPNDVWNDYSALLAHHAKVGRAASDPILCDCDDLTAICVACGLYGAWKAAGAPMKNGRPTDPKGADFAVTITRPPKSQMAHAFMLSASKPIEGEPLIQVGGRWVFDPAGRWGMRRPNDNFYGHGDVAIFPLRLSDL